MVSNGQLRLLSALSEGDVKQYAPSVEDGSDDVRYADAERVLADSEETPYDALEALAERGVLYREFQEKKYICPSCRTQGLQFTTGCESCGSTHTIETELLVHPACGYADVESAYGVGTDSGVGECPRCGAAIDPEKQLEPAVRYRCQECGATTDSPGHGLRCRACEEVHRPAEAIERLLYRYTFDEGGEAWLDRQLSIRETLADSLDDRGFEVRVDTEVESGERRYLVDLLGTDELLGERVLGAIHERPDARAVERLLEAAEAASARPVLVTTSGTLEANAADIVEKREIRTLSPDGNGLAPSYEVVGEYEAPTVFQQLKSSVADRL